MGIDPRDLMHSTLAFPPLGFLGHPYYLLGTLFRKTNKNKDEVSSDLTRSPAKMRRTASDSIKALRGIR